jgi:hypothetical protein
VGNKQEQALANGNRIETQNGGLLSARTQIQEKQKQPGCQNETLCAQIENRTKEMIL